MDLEIFPIAYCLYIHKETSAHLFRAFHFASERQYTKMMTELFDYHYMKDELEDQIKCMSIGQQDILTNVLKGSI